MPNIICEKLSLTHCPTRVRLQPEQRPRRGHSPPSPSDSLFPPSVPHLPQVLRPHRPPSPPHIWPTIRPSALLAAVQPSLHPKSVIAIPVICCIK